MANQNAIISEFPQSGWLIEAEPIGDLFMIRGSKGDDLNMGKTRFFVWGKNPVTPRTYRYVLNAADLGASVEIVERLLNK